MPKPKERILGKVTKLQMTPEMHQKLRDLTHGQGGYQDTCSRILALIRTVEGIPTVQLPARELNSLKEWAGRSDRGSWQDWARTFLQYNDLA